MKGVGLEQWLANSSMLQNHLEVCLVKTQIARSHPRVSDSEGWEWGLRICISSKLPGDAAAADCLRPMFREPLV